jgi:hypothetical protein
MSITINSEMFGKQAFGLLQETFEKVNGIYLDGGTSFFDTLDSLSATEASRPITPNGTSIAGQTEHVLFYTRILEAYMDKNPPKGTDWSQSWLVKTVNENEWNIMRDRVRSDYQRLVDRFKTADWNDESRLGGALAIIVHTAYHLGAIRQILHIAKKG